MISPFVRRRRLAAELLRLREDRGYSADRLAKAIGVPRQRISRLENGHVRPDLDEIMQMLTELGVGQEHRDKIMMVARDAQERGWWEKLAAQMGPRQALYANLEAGAQTICEYQLTLLPGLLQVPSFTEARARIDHSAHGYGFDLARAVEARAARQHVLARPGGPAYEVIVDELAVRRLAAPPSVVVAQLDHLVHVGHDRKRITIRVLPMAARIADYAIARSSFSIYRYPDPEDPLVVAVDTVTSDLVLTEEPDVGYYLSLYERLRAAALAPADSLDFLVAMAEDLQHRKE